MSTEGITIAQRLGRGKIRSSRSKSVGTKLTLSEERELVRAAEAEGKSVSEWAREALLREARRPADDPLLTELTSIRMLLVVLVKPLLLKQTVTAEWITEALAIIRREKRKATQETLQQYRMNRKADDRDGE